jgi:MoaD family protein
MKIGFYQNAVYDEASVGCVRVSVPVIRLFANLRKLAGFKETHVQGETIRQALLALCESYPALSQQLFADGKLREQYLISLNGQNINLFNSSSGTRPLEIPVQPDDEIAIFPPIAGG